MGRLGCISWFWFYALDDGSLGAWGWLYCYMVIWLAGWGLGDGFWFCGFLVLRFFGCSWGSCWTVSCRQLGTVHSSWFLGFSPEEQCEDLSGWLDGRACCSGNQKPKTRNFEQPQNYRPSRNGGAAVHYWDQVKEYGDNYQPGGLYALVERVTEFFIIGYIFIGQGFQKVGQISFFLFR